MSMRVFAALVLSALSLGVHAEQLNESYAFALLGDPKYSNDFSHYDYVNPAAPKGGDIRLAAIGGYDSFNRYASRGVPGQRTGELYDPLFATSDDEPGSYYPLIAESARYPQDMRWMELNINALARFQDGSPITAADVAFSFNKFMTEGVPQFRAYYRGITVKAISRLTVRIEQSRPDRVQMLSLLGLKVLPQSFWQNHKLSEPLSTPPLGSGPYKISDYRLGQSITYQRVRNYWAAGLPVNRGRFNFDTIRYEYYPDEQAALEAFKAGAYDFRSESSPKSWASQYQGDNFTRGYIVKRDDVSQAAQNARWLAFNIQRPPFNDRRVREAITLAFDFEWMNKTLYNNAYQRADSYFQNTPYAAKGYPNAEELALLAPLKGKVPPEVFTGIYQPPRSDGSGNERQNLLKAAQLLKEAGWEPGDQRLVNAQGQPLTFELLLPDNSTFQYVQPFQRNLQRLGISMKLRNVSATQYAQRLRKRDYDMVAIVYPAMPYPNADLPFYWSSGRLDAGHNASGVSDPAVDTLIAQIVKNQNNAKALLPLGRALDRVLTWNHYMLPMWYSSHVRYAFWDKFSSPAIRPANAIGLDDWWFDVNKAARLPAQR
ncbi:MAG: extracellular solute-binding protein [Serratia rubidaea]|uniref:extracellular solute-binding protein n=1 Tax=Serratia sp. Tan611 TaxID=2773264 RepID=UPI00193189AD|nr:extracellular solute-binding protein [Serratia sp. Tan611]MCA4822733.1 extracellular solute-binding protein [Serratia rubidaea]CAE1147957.1 putative oligopeptide transporter subunit; periplasmic-binding component of ABC superfamily transporter [Serratia sp. Tan611]